MFYIFMKFEKLKKLVCYYLWYAITCIILYYYYVFDIDCYYTKNKSYM